MDGKRIRFEETEFDRIQIYVQEVVHVVMDANREIEVTFCGLTDWKSLPSDWTQIEHTNDQMIFNSQDHVYTDSIT
jgi:RNA 3'-terminal phosphate cyclase